MGAVLHAISLAMSHLHWRDAIEAKLLPHLVLFELAWYVAYEHFALLIVPPPSALPTSHSAAHRAAACQGTAQQA